MKPTLQQITSSDAQSFRLFRREDKQFAFHWHQHREIELTLITAGHGQRYVGDHVAAYGPGNLVMMGENLPHTWRSERSETHGAIVVQFERDFLGEAFWERPELRRVGSLLDRASRGLCFSGRVKNEAGELLAQAVEASSLQRLLLLLKVLERLSGTRQFEVLSSPLAHSPVRAIDEERIASACDLIASRYDEGIRLADVAKRAGMSEASFSRYFKHHTGRTFIDYVNELRVGCACRLLIETGDSITDIAFASGFGNLANFNRRFKRLKGSTPRDYRKAYTGDGS